MIKNVLNTCTIVGGTIIWSGVVVTAVEILGRVCDKISEYRKEGSIKTKD